MSTQRFLRRSFSSRLLQLPGTLKEREEGRKSKTQTEKVRRITKAKKGEYAAKTRKEFKVLTLDDEVKKSLEPRVNYKEQLLMVRTAGKRERVRNVSFMRARWI
ncbi:hypothetical protein RB195_018523 [Necator americanus]|uniref:Uncharacterized protein n=1 Tax=Necator americanus TaxID=51031 RepID=A0ABR1CA57_NECAM